jgi:hypothetical protein
MLLGESRDTTVRELLDPVSGLPHPILNGDGEARAPSITVEYIPLRAFFGGQSGAVVDESCSKELEFLLLCVTLPGPLLAIFPVFVLSLLEGANETPRNVRDCVKVIRDLDGGCSSAG